MSPAGRDLRAIDTIERRTRGLIVPSGLQSTDQWFDCKYPGSPRWRIDARWIEFECGCRSERCTKLHGVKLMNGVPCDPVIFYQLPEQAVYDFVCDRTIRARDGTEYPSHHAQLNARLGFIAHGMTFDQWKRSRRDRLMGRAGRARQVRI